MNHFAQIQIVLPPAPIFYVGPLPITNSMISGVISVAVMFALLLYARANVLRGKRNFVTGMIQWTIEGMYGQILDIIPDKKIAKSIAPLALTMFFTVLFTYWASVMPGIGDVVTVNGHALFRSLSTDLNFTFALAIIALIVAQGYAIKSHGVFGNIRRYAVNPFKNPIGAFEGLLEFIGEFSRFTALSLRLFGNAFAGEVLLAVVLMLSGYFASFSLPLFIAFELFIGFIQAYVFMVLTCIFTALGVASHGAPEPAHSPTSTVENEDQHLGN